MRHTHEENNYQIPEIVTSPSLYTLYTPIYPIYTNLVQHDSIYKTYTEINSLKRFSAD